MFEVACSPSFKTAYRAHDMVDAKKGSAMLRALLVVAGLDADLVNLLQQMPGDALLVLTILGFVVVILVLTNERACERLIRVLKALRKR